ncbi:MAG: EAL domain-containing protein [Casimicrobiaceae bacterium]
MTSRTLQTRIVALFLALLLVMQVGTFVVINTVGVSAARKSIGDELVAGGQLFHRLLEQDRQRLAQGARLLSADYAFRDAIATNNKGMIASVLASHGKRIDAALTMLIGLDEHVIADTIDAGVNEPFLFPRLLADAQARRQASAIVVIRGQLYQLVIVPVLAAQPLAWIAVGIPVDNAIATQMRALMRMEVSFVSHLEGGKWKLQGTTLKPGAQAALVDQLAGNRFAYPDEKGNAAADEDVVTRVMALPAHTDDAVYAVLQQPVSAALEPFRRLQVQLAVVFAVAAIISILASLFLARGIARPVRELAVVARRIASGDYSAAPPKAQTREIGDLAAAFRSMQERIASRESRIMDLAYRDTLTGLPNRALYIERLEEALAEAVEARKPVAVILMDLDHFKDVNDTLGHSIGDLLLREVAIRLTYVVKGQASIVARLGGDEFAVLMPGEGPAQGEAVARAICRSLEAPMTLDGHLVDVRASVGIAIFPDHGVERSTLLRHADVAMYAAKRNNTGIAMWDMRYDDHSSERLSLMGDLRKAVDQHQLTLVYQPKVSLKVDAQLCVEALVRWQHPTRGLVPPAEFIPFAEQTGYIRAITQWVLARAIGQCAMWRADGLAMTVSINISARDLMDRELPERFAALLDQHGCAARWIALEITESAILDDPGHAIENLQRLHALGCKIAIDDYGTGYSSLAYLRRLPLHELKIDKSFVLGMVSDPSDAVIVRSTIDLAHHMGLSVVAEGVEDEATLDRLRALGCDMVQGYHLSRPMIPEDVPNWMRTTASRAGGKDPTLRRVV